MSRPAVPDERIDVFVDGRASPLEENSGLIDLVVTPAAAVEMIDVGVDGSAVLLDQHRTRAYPVSSSGALVWACLDGVSTLADICHDISDELGVPFDRVTSHVASLGRGLLDSGMATVPGRDLPAAHSEECMCGALPAFGHLSTGDERNDAFSGSGGWLEERPRFCGDAGATSGATFEVVARLVVEGRADRFVGIRTNDATLTDDIRRRLGPLLADEPFCFPNISVNFGAQQGRLTGTNVVLRRGVEAFRSFSREDAIAAALAQLHTFRPIPDGLLQLHARALERDGAAVLVADTFAPTIDAAHRRLAAAGFSILPHTPVLVDPIAGEALLPRGSDLSSPEMIRVPIAHVTVSGRIDPDLPASSRLLRGDGLIIGPNRPLRTNDLRALATLVATVPLVGIDELAPRRVVDAIAAV